MSLTQKSKKIKNKISFYFFSFISTGAYYIYLKSLNEKMIEKNHFTEIHNRDKKTISVIFIFKDPF